MKVISYKLRSHATVHDGQIITETVQRRAPGNVGNTGNRGTQNYGQMTDNVGKKVICYNCRGEGHVSRQCKEKKRVKDSQYFKDKMLLMEAKEKGTVLDAEAEAFLADVECTAPYDQPLAITTTNMFEVSHEGRVDSVIVDEGPPCTAAAFMANLSSTSGTNDATTSHTNKLNALYSHLFLRGIVPRTCLCVTAVDRATQITSEKPKVIAPGMYSISPKYIPPQRRVNRAIPTLLLKKQIMEPIVEPLELTPSVSSSSKVTMISRFTDCKLSDQSLVSKALEWKPVKKVLIELYMIHSAVLHIAGDRPTFFQPRVDTPEQHELIEDGSQKLHESASMSMSGQSSANGELTIKIISNSRKSEIKDEVIKSSNSSFKD
ncbi:reverse transcriptase domain-containing protein [Tanacetum coccineum]